MRSKILQGNHKILILFHHLAELLDNLLIFHTTVP